MGKGGQGESNGHLVSKRELKEYSWDDIGQKSNKTSGERWIVIDGQVYNITNWVKRHPGGQRVITHYAGQDATDAFAAFHNDKNFVRKYMKALHVGSVKKDEQKPQKPIEEDFRQLRETAEKMNLFKASYWFFCLQLLHIILLDVAAWGVLVYFGTGWLPFISSLLLITTVESQCSWLQHDFGHLAVFKQSWLNHLFHYLVMGVMEGASPGWWNHMHYQHHAKPNVMDKDPDIRLDVLFVVGEHMPVEKAKTKTGGSMPYNWQNFYFFLIGPPLLFPVYFQFMLFRFIFTRKAWSDLLAVTLFFIKFFVLYLPLLGFGWTIFYYFAFRVLESHWFTWVSQSNHIPMDIDHDSAKPWLPLQLHATCNVEKSAFNDWFTGHLNFQIEHHLFPTMPRHNLYKIAPLVKSLCQKHNLPYHVKPLYTAFADIVRSLKHSGELWHSTYVTYHADAHQ